MKNKYIVVLIILLIKYIISDSIFIDGTHVNLSVTWKVFAITLRDKNASP